MIKKINQILHPSNLLVSYWAIFWLMNGLDKFFNRTQFGAFSWHGKDRSDQFSGYFSNTGLPESLISPLLYLVGVSQLAIFIVFIIAIRFKTKRPNVSAEYLKLGLSLGTAVFILFSFFDVIFGDRAELWEHGTFLVLLAVTYLVVFDSKELQFFTETSSLQTIDSHLAKGEFNKAMSMCKKLHKDRPNDSNVFLITAKTLFLAGKKQEAKKILDKLVIKDPTFKTEANKFLDTYKTNPQTNTQTTTQATA